MYDFSELKETMHSLGIGVGDKLYVASDVTLLLCSTYKQGMKTKEQMDEYLHKLVSAFQQVVGKSGTLLFPVFTWDFCRGKGFDVCRTLGEVGSLNNWILLNRQDFLRTRHPMYSFMVWGEDAPLLAALDNTDAWGQDSPFAYLHHHGGKMLLFNVSLQRGFTFLHYVEESVKVPYRYMKSFCGKYKDGRGRDFERIYTMYVRDLDIVSEEYLPEEFLQSAGVMKSEQWGDIIIKNIGLHDAYDVVANNLYCHNGSYCYKFTDYEINWDGGATHADDFGNGLP